MLRLLVAGFGAVFVGALVREIRRNWRAIRRGEELPPEPVVIEPIHPPLDDGG